MKAERWICGLWGCLLSFCAAFGAVGGLVSGLGLSENAALLAMIFAFMAILTAVCCVFRLYLVPLAGLLLTSLIFWKPLLASARYLVTQAATLYDMAYHWGVPIWEDEAAVASSALWLLIVLGGCMICLVMTAVLSGRGLKLCALMTLLPLVPCIVVTDTVPATEYIFLFLVSTLYLLLCDNVRIGSLRKSNALMLGLVLPTLLGLVLLFVLVPREGYDGQAGAQKLEDLVVSLLDWQNTPADTPQIQTPGQQANETELDLKDVGHNPALGVPVMSVKAETTGTMYLRGCIYDVYTGTDWQTSGTAAGNNVYSVAQGPLRQVTVQTVRVHDILYVPYVTEQVNGKLVDGQLLNSQKLREYTLFYREPATVDLSVTNPINILPEGFGEVFLQLPQETKVWASSYILPQVLHLKAEGKLREAAAEIGKQVRGSARYERMVNAMPRNETDFARWFLEQDAGYCTHFASLAVVLLRGAGIPARYVTGYLVHTQAGEFAQVTTDDAHAWAEYYIQGLGWVVLETTPASEQTTVLPSPTEPSFTEPSTVQTEGTSPSGETETAVPSQSTTAPSQTQTPSSETVNGTSPIKPDGDSETPETPRDLPGWLKTASCCLLAAFAFAAAVIGQWQLRLRLRRRWQSRGKANTRLLKRWQEAERLCSLLKQQPPEELRQLALKARFSQHPVEAWEFGEFDRSLTVLRSGLRQKRWYWQLYYRLILALY